MSEPRCSVCGVTPDERPALVLITHELRGRKRTIAWTLCVPCHLREERS